MPKAVCKKKMNQKRDQKYALKPIPGTKFSILPPNTKRRREKIIVALIEAIKPCKAPSRRKGPRTNQLEAPTNFIISISSFRE